jgi:hypothetical protein
MPKSVACSTKTAVNNAFSVAAMAVLALLLSFLASCGSPDAPPEPTVANEPTHSSDRLPAETLPQGANASRDTLTEDGKRIIYIGSFSGGSQEVEDAYDYITAAVGSFNITNTECEVRIVDYGTAYEIDSLYRLNAEIVGGIMPDILVTHGMPVNSYHSKGLLYDINDWIEPELFYSGPLESMRANDGRLYSVSPLFTVTTFYGLTKYVGESGELTLDNLYEIWTKFFENGGESFISGVSNEFICMLMVSWFENEFVDEYNGVCNFDSPRFTELLEFCKSLPANPPALNVKEDIGLDGSGIFQSVLKSPDLHYANAVKREKSLLGVLRTPRYWGLVYPTHWMVKLALADADYRYIGIPGANTGSVFMDVPISVSAESGNLDIVKLFVNKLWTRTESYNGKVSLNRFPLKRSVIETLNRNAAVSGETALFGYVENMLGWFSSNPNVPVYTMSDFEELQTIVEEANLHSGSPLVFYMAPLSRSQVRGDRLDSGFEPDLSIYMNSIIYEELRAFFAGTQDSVHTAKLIQSRYSIYLNEQK